jgi:hypothetical protein
MPEDKNVVRLDGPHEFLPREETALSEAVKQFRREAKGTSANKPSRWEAPHAVAEEAVTLCRPRETRQIDYFTLPHWSRLPSEPRASASGPTRVPCPLPTGTPLPKRPHKLTPQETHA